jgi:hypothetical protein
VHHPTVTVPISIFSQTPCRPRYISWAPQPQTPEAPIVNPVETQQTHASAATSVVMIRQTGPLYRREDFFSQDRQATQEFQSRLGATITWYFDHDWIRGYEDVACLLQNSLALLHN